MFRWLGNIVAPPPKKTAIDTLKENIDKLVFYYEKPEEENTNIETLKQSINDIVEVLLNEYSILVTSSTPQTTPCMDFVKKNQIIEFLCNIANFDKPVGMRRHTVTAITSLLRNLRLKIIQVTTIHDPLTKLIRACHCGDIKEREQAIDLCSTIMQCFAEDQNLANVLFDCNKEKDVNAFPIYMMLDAHMNMESATGERARHALLGVISSSVPICELVMHRFQFTSALMSDWGDSFNTQIMKVKQAALAPEAVGPTHQVRFCNQLLKLIPEPKRQILIEKFQTDLLHGPIKETLLRNDNKLVIAATYYVTALLLSDLHPVFMKNLISFLVGTYRSVPEIEGQPLVDENDLIRHSIITRIQSANERDSISVLRLFDALLNKNNALVFNNLVLRNFKNGKHLLSTSQLNDRNFDTEKLFPSIQKFLMMPFNDKSHIANSLDKQYEWYLLEAQANVASTLCSCNWTEIGVEFTLEAPDTNPQPFFEGAFLRALYFRLEKLFDNSFGLNLLLTQIIGKLARYSHPFINDYFLNPSVSLAPNVRSLYKILHTLSLEVAKRTASFPGFYNEFQSTRQELFTHNDPAVDKFLIGTVVLFEFCKELAAILQVKASFGDLTEFQWHIPQEEKKQVIVEARANKRPQPSKGVTIV